MSASPGDDLQADPTAPYAGFEGRIGRTFATSDPWWPAQPTAPEGAPNVLIVLADDLGFADLGCYGSEIATPHLDRLADEGVRYTNFHVTPMCSPTRAALLTGVNPHAAGVGTVAQIDPGFPGYGMELPEHVATMAEVFRSNGYATSMVGKWHLAKDWNISDAGPRHSWPLQRGFERFYGFLGPFTNYHHPHRLVEDNHAVRVDRWPDGYYFTDDITDRAISMIREAKASNPRKPFFCYFAHGAVHAPLHAKVADIEKYRDAYHVGWDVIRERRFERQQALGVLPQGTVLPPRNSERSHGVKPWADLSDREQRLFARYKAVYAAMVDNMDQSFGRLRAALEEIGEWDRTIVIFLSDNGASREGQAIGTSHYFRTLYRGHDFDEDYALLDEMGGPRTFPHYPRGWAMASGTPWRLYKINTHAGGHTVPFIVSWPERLRERGAIRSQYAYVTDVLPTLLELTGVAAPAERNGRPIKPLDGVSFAATLDASGAPSSRSEQYFEMNGHRGYYRDGWEVVTLHEPRTPFSEDHWELYDLRSDPAETRDLAAEHPEKLRELVEAWERAAWENQVFPLDEGSGIARTQRSPAEAAFAEPVTIVPGTPQLEHQRSNLLIEQRSFTITISLEYELGDEGILLAHGDQAGGYALFIEDGELHLLWRAFGQESRFRGGRLAPGAHEIAIEAVAPGGNRYQLRLVVDGAETDSAPDVPMFARLSPFEGIDVGIDRGSPVSWDIYERHGPFPFSGALHSVAYLPGELAPDAPARRLEEMREIGTRYE